MPLRYIRRTRTRRPVLEFRHIYATDPHECLPPDMALADVSPELRGAAPRDAVREQLGAVFREPVSLLQVRRSRSRHQLPELRRVVVTDAVAELVHDDVGQNRLRRGDEAPVERERTALRARPPARLLVADGQARVRHTETRGLAFGHTRDLGARLLAVPEPERRDRRER